MMVFMDWWRFCFIEGLSVSLIDVFRGGWMNSWTYPANCWWTGAHWCVDLGEVVALPSAFLGCGWCYRWTPRREQLKRQRTWTFSEARSAMMGERGNLSARVFMQVFHGALDLVSWPSPVMQASYLATPNRRIQWSYQPYHSWVTIVSSSCPNIESL